MSKDKVLHPTNMDKKAPVGEKQVKSAIIEGPTQTTENLTPYNRKKS